LGNVVFGWFVLWLLFFTGSSSSPMKGWIEFLCSVDDASSVWCSYPSQGHQKSGKLLPKQDVRTLISVCCVCVWLMPHKSKTSLFATLCNMHSHCGEGSLLFVTLFWLFLFCLDFIIAPLQFLMGSYPETSMNSAELHFCFKVW
jgi:hypothetical protein